MTEHVPPDVFDTEQFAVPLEADPVAIAVHWLPKVPVEFALTEQVPDEYAEQSTYAPVSVAPALQLWCSPAYVEQLVPLPLAEHELPGAELDAPALHADAPSLPPGLCPPAALHVVVESGPIPPAEQDWPPPPIAEQVVLFDPDGTGGFAGTYAEQVVAVLVLPAVEQVTPLSSEGVFEEQAVAVGTVAVTEHPTGPAVPGAPV